MKDFKLNDHGWGLGVFLIFLFIFILFILIIACNVDHLGLNDKSNRQESSNDEKEIFYSSNKTSTAKQEYNALELQLLDAGKKYQERYYTTLLEDDSVYVTVKKLLSSQDLSNFTDQNGKKCTGYVKIVKKDDINTFFPYIKCDHYTTNGYEKHLDDVGV